MSLFTTTLAGQRGSRTLNTGATRCFAYSSSPTRAQVKDVCLQIKLLTYCKEFDENRREFAGGEGLEPDQPSALDAAALPIVLPTYFILRAAP